MRLPIEPWLRLEDSICWRLHDAYFEERGAEAWTRGEVPFDATSNYGIACQHARFLAAIGARLPADREVWVLDVGSGLGRLVTNLARALANDAGEAGRALLSRLRLVASDYARRSVEDLATSPGVADLVARGTVIPATYDLRTPGRAPVGLDGQALDVPFDAVLASYVCCVVPPRVVQRRGGVWYEQLVRVEAENDDAVDPDVVRRVGAGNVAPGALLESLAIERTWHPTALEASLSGEHHADIVRHATRALKDATVMYPAPFIDFLDGVSVRLADAGVVVINDYGKVDGRDLAGLEAREPQTYGNSFAFEVSFSLFDAFAETSGWHILATDEPDRALHTAVLRPIRRFEADEVEAFEAHYQRSHMGEDLIDFYDLATEHESLDHERSARLFRRCAEIDPDNPLYRYKLADVLIEAGYHTAAIAESHRGMALPGSELHDFEFLLGRAHCLLDELDEAARWYQRSLERDAHPVTLTNLGILYEHFGRLGEALASYRRALTLRPDDARALDRLAKLGERLDTAQREGSMPPGPREISGA